MYTLHIKTSTHIRKGLKLKSATTVDFFTSGEKVCNSALQILLLWAFPGTSKDWFIEIQQIVQIFKMGLLTWIGISLCLIRFFFLMVPCPAETEVLCIYFILLPFSFDGKPQNCFFSSQYWQNLIYHRIHCFLTKLSPPICLSLLSN